MRHAAGLKDPDNVGESSECRDVLGHASYQVAIGRDGLYFTPAFLPLEGPDCTTTLRLSFSQLKPLLSPLGRQQMGALFADKKGGSGKK
ncbi:MULTISPECIES: hypothetical protein [Acidithiobacillus]|uniref:hypothetical protein n=1 Tax=Acidithiobacillus TaxID=119977 RepID=UPI001CF2CA0F|nr:MULTISPECIES: hypothetical protein [Acidithiobacillus]WMT48115.1 MAG: hypothetical protein RE468_05750 [Acidithiobacillus caldus]